MLLLPVRGWCGRGRSRVAALLLLSVLWLLSILLRLLPVLLRWCRRLVAAARRIR